MCRQLVGSLCKRHAVTTIKEAPTACRRTGSGSLSLPYSGCFSPFPHGTGTLSVSYEYLALADGPAGFTQDYTCPALLRGTLCLRRLRVRDFHPLRTDFPDGSPHRSSVQHRGPTTPQGPEPPRFGLLPVRSPLLGESLLFSLPRGTKMFQFPRFASAIADDSPSDCRVFPFGHPRITGHLHLPADFRSLSRPSSPVRAQASTVRPSSLGYHLHMPKPEHAAPREGNAHGTA